MDFGSIADPYPCDVKKRETCLFLALLLKHLAWETLATVDPILRLLEKAEVVARFHQTTAHNFLGVYLQWFGLAVDDVCPLCGHVRMDGDHLLQSTGLV
ncbi:reverse transcriptase [Trichonephila clavipes]|nr:reverse transcriptase [Trichonephila clavipes]